MRTSIKDGLVVQATGKEPVKDGAVAIDDGLPALCASIGNKRIQLSPTTRISFSRISFVCSR
jgi:hypothetical protein